MLASKTTLLCPSHTLNNLIIKTVHHVVHVTSTEAKLFAIRYGIDQALKFDNVSKVIVITDSIHVAKEIFEPTVHPYQVQSVAILSDLHKFFMYHKNNSIKFWECPSRLKWHLHNEVNKESKTFNPVPLFPSKISWNFSKKRESNDILKVWKMTFQASNIKGNQFLDLLDDDNSIIEPSYVKGGSWLKTFGHSNLLCACATRAITNHAPIGEYRLRFFLREEFKCLCSLYLIESRCHILHECCGNHFVKIVDSGLHLFYFFHFIFHFFYFLFSIFRTTWVRGYQSRCHISHKLMAQSQD